MDEQSPRRSMSAALQTAELPPQAIELINAGKPKPVMAQSVVAREAASTPELKSESVREVHEAANLHNGSKAERAARAPVSREKENEMAPHNAIVSRSFRLPAELATALLRASTERRINRIKPSSQEEMVAEAIIQWLKKNGYVVA